MASATLEMQSYSFQPSEVKPGTIGTLTLVLVNSTGGGYSGALLRTAGDFLANRDYSIGDVGFGGTTTLIVPFRVSRDTPSGVYGLTMQLYYTSDGTQKQKNLVVPMTIVNAPDITAETLNVSKKFLSVGDNFQVQFSLRNTGGRITDLEVWPDSQNFLLADATKVSVGTLAANSSTTVTVSFTYNSVVYSSYYNIPVLLKYRNELGEEKTTDIEIPLNLANVNLEIKNVDILPSDYTSGDQIMVSITFTNKGIDLQNLQACISSTMFPEQCSFIGAISSAASATTVFTANIPSNAKSGSMELRFFGKDFTIKQTIPLTIHEKLARLAVSRVKSDPAILRQGGQATLEIKIENYGKGGAKNVRATLTLDGKDYDAIVGRIDGDDRANANFYIPEITQQGVIKTPFKIYFEDSRGEQIVTEELPLSIEASRSGSPLIIIFAIVLAVLAYVFRKRLIKFAEGIWGRRK
jgi:hypothetical protein